jgi:hypothetical protein
MIATIMSFSLMQSFVLNYFGFCSSIWTRGFSPLQAKSSIVPQFIACTALLVAHTYSMLLPKRLLHIVSCRFIQKTSFTIMSINLVPLRLFRRSLCTCSAHSSAVPRWINSEIRNLSGTGFFMASAYHKITQNKQEDMSRQDSTCEHRKSGHLCGR